MGYHNTEGLSKAEAQALKLASDLLMERFRWEEWRKPKGTREKSPTVIEWVKEFRAYYQATHSLSERTWERHWQHVYSDLIWNERNQIYVIYVKEGKTGWCREMVDFPANLACLGQSGRVKGFD